MECGKETLNFTLWKNHQKMLSGHDTDQMIINVYVTIFVVNIMINTAS